ncbi:MAG: multidrug efflux SMR transporter [Candidatus Brocadia sp.]|jgi:small multidrug resistance pump
MSWVYLILAIILEVSGTTCMKLSRGFTQVLPSLLLFIFYGFSFTSFSFALKKLDVSVAYVVWSGLGTTLITAVGIIWFKEPLSVLKIISIGLIIIGMIGLRLNGGIR